MSPKQAATLAEALSGRIPVLLLVHADGTCSVVLRDRARADQLARDLHAVVVEMVPAKQAPSAP